MFTDSLGNKWDKKQIDEKVRQAKQKKIAQVQDEHGYVFCENCGRSGGVRLDCAHVVSVDKAQKDKKHKLELAWDVDNIKILCRACHQKHDKLTLF